MSQPRNYSYLLVLPLIYLLPVVRINSNPPTSNFANNGCSRSFKYNLNMLVLQYYYSTALAEVSLIWWPLAGKPQRLTSVVMSAWWPSPSPPLPPPPPPETLVTQSEAPGATAAALFSLAWSRHSCCSSWGSGWCQRRPRPPSW